MWNIDHVEKKIEVFENFVCQYLTRTENLKQYA